MGLKANDWLVIPLCKNHHTGRAGIDTGAGIFRCVSAWEDANGFQLVHLIRVAMTLKVDIFDRSGVNLSRLWDSAFSIARNAGPNSTKIFPRRKP